MSCADFFYSLLQPLSCCPIYFCCIYTKLLLLIPMLKSQCKFIYPLLHNKYENKTIKNILFNFQQPKYILYHRTYIKITEKARNRYDLYCRTYKKHFFLNKVTRIPLNKILNVKFLKCRSGILYRKRHKQKKFLMVKCGTKNDSFFCKIPRIAYKLRVGEISNESSQKLLYISFCRHCIWAREPLHSHFLGTRGENRLSCLHNRQSLLCKNQQYLPVKTKIGHFL